MKVAIIHNWPGQRNSELELIKRISRIAGKLGHECTVVDPLGHALTGDGQHLDTVKFIDARKYDFCLHLHYVNPNLFDTFSYAVNWNPLDFVVRNPIGGNDLPKDDVAYRTCCLASHDALLSAGSNQMDEFAEALNLFMPMQIADQDLCLHTTCDVAEGIDFPDFKRFKVFYIGANWERQQGIKRHDGIIEQLDASSLVEFYGLKKQNGVALWEGVKNYKGELPFDGGRSIIERSNKCGVSLVLHSKAHCDSGLVSTRLFQACAAKTLTICDDNPFILKHFGDSVLSFKSGADPEENASGIMEQVEWIRNNPDEALEKAKRAHQIFADNFSLQKEVGNLFELHQENVSRYLKEFGANDSSLTVDALYIQRGGDNTQLKNFFTDIAAQVGVRIRAVVFTLTCNSDCVREVAEQYDLVCEIIQWDREADSLPLDGRLIANYLKSFNCRSLFAFYSSTCRWHKYHLTQLVRALEGKGAVAMSGTYVKNDLFDKLLDDYYILAMSSVDGHPKGITEQDLGAFKANRFPPASFLFSSSHFQNKTLLKTLPFFDSGWAFFLVLWSYLYTLSLPFFIPKLTVMYQQKGGKWEKEIYVGKHQGKAFETSLAFAFLKNDPNYLSLVERCKSEVNEAILPFSFNKKVQSLLKNRLLLLKAYRRFFKFVCFLFRMPYKEIYIPDKK